MLDNTDISNGMSDAFPPSLTHGCAEKQAFHKRARKKIIELKNQ